VGGGGRRLRRAGAACCRPCARAGRAGDAPMSVVLDSGALIAVDRRDRTVGAMLRLLQQEARPLVTSGAVVAQVWRNGARQALLARVLTGVRIEGLDASSGRRVGALLAEARTDDVVDGHVAHLVTDAGTVLTSDPADVRRLLVARRVEASVVA